MTEQQHKQAVLDTMAVQISQRLKKLGASEESTLRNAHATIPGTVYKAVLANMADQNLIKKVRSHDGLILIARNEATKAELTAAAKRSRQALKATTTRAKKSQLAKNMPLFVDEPHYSESHTYGLSYEQALDADPIDAETSTKLNNETDSYGNTGTITDGMKEDKVRLVMKQELTGQGERNARRAKLNYVRKQKNLEAAVEAHEAQMA